MPFLHKVQSPRVLQLAPADVASSTTAFAATVRRPYYCTIFSSLSLSLSIFPSIQSLLRSDAAAAAVYARSNGSLLCRTDGRTDGGMVDARARIFVRCVTRRPDIGYALRWRAVNNDGTSFLVS